MIFNNVTDELAFVSLELRLMRQNFARLLDECADQLDGKTKRRDAYPRYLRTVAETLRDQARTEK